MYIYYIYLPNRSACELLNSSRFDSKSEATRSKSEAKQKAKRSEVKAK